MACLIAGLWFSLGSLSPLKAILDAKAWWPALPAAAGVIILLRSPKPGPHIVFSICLIASGLLCFAASHGFIAGRTWSFIGAGVLIIIGAAMIGSVIRTRGTKVNPERAMALLRTTKAPPHSPDLNYIRAIVLCGTLKLDLRQALFAGQQRNVPLTIEVIALIGKITLENVPPGTKVINHKAFALNLNRPIQVGVLDESKTLEAQLVIATIAFLGDVEVMDAHLPDSGVPGNLPGAGHQRRASCRWL
jgi:hypothetical protein